MTYMRDEELPLVGIDVSFFFNAELFNNHSVNYYLEPLTDFEDNTELPIISKNYSASYFYSS
jgi:hypothetical protein